MNEADTCRKYVLPKLVAAGWDNEPYSFTEQKTFTDGRIILEQKGYKRGKQKRSDYLLRYRRNFPISKGIFEKVYTGKTGSNLLFFSKIGSSIRVF